VREERKLKLGNNYWRGEVGVTTSSEEETETWHKANGTDAQREEKRGELDSRDRVRRSSKTGRAFSRTFVGKGERTSEEPGMRLDDRGGTGGVVIRQIKLNRQCRSKKRLGGCHCRSGQGP